MSIKKLRVYDKTKKAFISLDEYQALGAIVVENDGTLTLGTNYRFLSNMMIATDAFDVQLGTGLLDAAGNEVYEGDILESAAFGTDEMGEVIFQDGYFYILIDDNVLIEIENVSEYFVVGHINQEKGDEEECIIEENEEI